MKLIISQSANKKKNRKKTKRKFQITQFHMNKIPNWKNPSNMDILFLETSNQTI